MSNSRRKKLTSRVDEDASPTFSMVNLRQETTSMENTMKDHMEMMTIHENKQTLKSRGVGRRDKTEADIKPLTLHIETSAGDLSGCVSPDAVPFTPETGCVRPNTYSVAPRTTPAQQTPSNAQQSTASAHQVPSGAGHCEAPPPATRPQSRSPPDNFPAKSKCGKDDLPDDISLQLQVSVNALLDRESGHSNEDKKLSNKAVSVSSSSKTVSSSSASVSSSSVPVSSSSATSYAVAVSSSSSEELCVSTMKLSEEEDDDIPDSMVPVEVGLRCYDILLLHSEDEPENAWEVKKHLETELLLSNGERIQVLLYEELVQIFRRQIGCLKEGMDHCTFVFILITKTFCESDLSRFLGEECLIKSIHDANKRWSVVPLFTQPKRSADYCIPTGLNCLKGISYHTRDEFYSSNMIKMIEQRRYIKNEREKKRLKRIKNWKEDKRHELLMERIKEEQREKQAKDLKEMQLQQLKKSLENAPVNPSYMAITSSSYNMPQAANSCKYPNTEQLGNFPPFPYPWTNPYGYPQYPHGQPMHLTMSYPHLQQAWGGYGMPPGFGGITESHSMPGNMAEMAGYSVGEQHGGHTVTLGARPPPYHQSDGKALEQAGLRRGPEPTEQIDTSLDGHKLSSKNEDTGQGTSSARFDTGDRCSDPKTGSSNNEMKTKEGLLKEQSFDAVTYLREEEPSTDPQRFPRTKKDYRQGSDNSTAYSETGFRESDQHEASLSQAVPIRASQSLPQASVSSSAHEHDEQAVTHHAGSCTDPLLDSSVEEDATKQIEETSVKQHLDGLRVRESSSTRAHGAPPATDSGYASSSRSTSKISTASYIQQSLGLMTPTKQSRSGVEQEDAKRSRSKPDSLSSSWTSESDSLSSALLAESVAESREQQFTGRTEQQGSVLREIHHHHHHHDSEAKKVIIIQNCDTVHLGDRSTVQNIPHDVAQYRTGHQGWDDRSETWQGEAGVWDEDEEERRYEEEERRYDEEERRYDEEDRRGNEAGDDRSDFSGEHRPQTLDAQMEDDTWVKVSTIDCSEMSITNNDQQTSLKTSTASESMMRDVPCTSDYTDLSASPLIQGHGEDADGVGVVGLGVEFREGKQPAPGVAECANAQRDKSDVGRSTAGEKANTKLHCETWMYKRKQTSSSSMLVCDRVKRGQHTDMVEAISLSGKGVCSTGETCVNTVGESGAELSMSQFDGHECGENKSAILSIISRYLPKEMIKQGNGDSRETGRTDVLPGTSSSNATPCLSLGSHETVLPGSSHEGVLSTSSHEAVLSASSHEAVLSASSHDAALSASSHEVVLSASSQEPSGSSHGGMLYVSSSMNESMFSDNSQQALSFDEPRDMSVDLSCEEGSSVDPRVGQPKRTRRSLQKKMGKDCVIS